MNEVPLTPLKPFGESKRGPDPPSGAEVPIGSSARVEVKEGKGSAVAGKGLGDGTFIAEGMPPTFEEHRKTWNRHCPITKEGKASVELGFRN